jgi:putative adenylate-forming enzyme
MRLFQITRSFLNYRYFLAVDSRDKLEAWQNRQVKKHLAWVCAHSPFYRDYFEGHSLENWRTLPLTDKTMMMENFDLLNTVGMSKERAMEVALKAETTRNFAPVLDGITVGLSSGTSGQRGLFLVSDKERYHWAGATLAKMLPDILSRPERVALFLRSNSNLYTSVQSKRILFDYFDLATDPSDTLYRLNRFNPSVFVAPPSMLRFLGRCREEGLLEVTPQKVITAAEVLDPFDERFISRQFGQQVHQMYQATEGFLGYTCDYGTLHLNEDIVVIEKEYLNQAKGKFVPIVTDFRRKTQPIIRYRLNDILTERKETCLCGSVLTALEFIEGREEDVFWLLSKEGDYCKVFPSTLRQVVEGVEGRLENYQISQNTLNHVRVSLSPLTLELKHHVERELNLLWQRLKVVPPQLEFVSFVPTVASKKMKRVESFVKQWSANSPSSEKEKGYTPVT